MNKFTITMYILSTIYVLYINFCSSIISKLIIILTIHTIEINLGGCNKLNTLTETFYLIHIIPTINLSNRPVSNIININELFQSHNSLFTEEINVTG